MATTNQLSGGAFQYPDGTPVTNGSMLLVLSTDATVNSNVQISAGWTVSLPLDANGNVVSSASEVVWPNDVLTPSGSFYMVSVYTENGQLVWGPNAQQVLSTPSPYNVGVWVPGIIEE